MDFLSRASMKNKLNILITNDDGIYAPGLKHLWAMLVDYANVTIIAPETEQSGKGLSITLRHPLLAEPVQWDKETPAWKVNGTPADCVRLAHSVILKREPDLIVSGINRGANLGRNVLYSGTVGGVIEGALRNIPGIAFSCADFQSPDYKAAEQYILPIVEQIVMHPLPGGTFLNVNFPLTSPIKGVKLARQGMGYWIESIEERLHPEGHPYYWLGGKWVDAIEHGESDVFLLQQGYAAAAPIHVNEWTDHVFLKDNKERFNARFNE
jgi:5'-nucleotidase